MSRPEFRIISFIAIAVAVVVAAGSMQASADEPNRHVEKWGGYSIALSKGWTAAVRPSNEFAILRTDATDIDRFNTIYISRLFTATTHETWSDRIEEITRTDHPGKTRDVRKTSFTTDDGIAGTQVIGFESYLTDKERRFGRFTLEVADILFQLDWFGPANNQPSTLEAVVAIVKSFRIEKADEPEEQFADGKQRCLEPLGGFSFIPPADWKAFDGGLGFRTHVHTSEDDDKRAIAIGRNPAPKGLEARVRGFVETYDEKVRGQTMQKDTVVIEPFKTSQGIEGRRVSFLIDRKRDGATIRCRIYMLVDDDEHSLEFGTFESSDHGDDNLEEYDAAAKTIRLESSTSETSEK